MFEDTLVDLVRAYMERMNSLEEIDTEIHKLEKRKEQEETAWKTTQQQFDALAEHISGERTFIFGDCIVTLRSKAIKGKERMEVEVEQATLVK